MSPVRSLAVTLLLGIAAGGCSAHLSDVPALPSNEMQKAWETSSAFTEGAPHEAWWKAFHDPVLDGLVAQADQRNLDLRRAGARVKEARAMRDAATAAFFPELTGTLSAGVQRTFINLTPTPRPMLIATGNVSWEADVFGRLRHTRTAEDAAWQGAQRDAEAVRLTLVSEVARTYVEYRLYQKQERISEDNAKAAAETLRIGRLRFEQGLGSRLEVERPLAAVAATKAQVATAHELAESARYQLVLLLATTPEGLAKVLPSEGALPQMDSASVLLTPMQVISRRPDVQSAAYGLLSAVARKEAAEALRWPRITLAGALGLQGENPQRMLAGGPLGSLGVSLLTPLLNFGRIRATIDATDARQEQAYWAYEQAARQALNEVQTAIVLYTQGMARRDELTVAVDAARRAGEIAKKQYAAGTISLLEVLDAERVLRENELGWSQATAEVSLRTVRLYQTMGVIPPRTPPS